MEVAVEQPETHVLVRHLETAALTGDGGMSSLLSFSALNYGINE